MSLKLTALSKLVRFGDHWVPGWWRQILPTEVWTWQIPQESRATCERCPKVVSDDYRPDYRCCTYHPTIPNFLLGFALYDAASRERVHRSCDAGYLTPEGARHSPAQWLEVLSSSARGGYGANDQVLCQFLDADKALCGLYSYRNSSCSTYFCKHDFGELGSEFWEALHHYVGRCEVALQQWSLEEVGFDYQLYLQRFDELAKLPVREVCHAKTGAWLPDAQRLLWGDWHDERLELLRRCAGVVADHADRLREIVSETKLYNPDLIELTALEHEEDDDSSKGGPLSGIGELYVDLQTSYHRLWKLPQNGMAMVLGQRTVITKNALTSAVDAFYEAFPYRVESGGAEEFYIGERLANALRHFSVPQTFGCTLLEQLSEMGIERPEAFLSEWLAKGVLDTTAKTEPE